MPIRSNRQVLWLTIMAKNYSLKILLRDQPDCLVFPVREGEADRLKKLLDHPQSASLEETEFFWFDTTDGKSVAINLRCLQAVHYLWDAAPYAADELRSEEGIQILFRGKSEPLHLSTDEPAQLYDFFTHLEYGPKVIRYPRFQDEDGETIQVNPLEIVWITAPKDLVNEGKQIVLNEMGQSE